MSGTPNGGGRQRTEEQHVSKKSVLNSKLAAKNGGSATSAKPDRAEQQRQAEVEAAETAARNQELASGSGPASTDGSRQAGGRDVAAEAEDFMANNGGESDSNSAVTDQADQFGDYQPDDGEGEANPGGDWLGDDPDGMLGGNSADMLDKLGDDLANAGLGDSNGLITEPGDNGAPGFSASDLADGGGFFDRAEASINDTVNGWLDSVREPNPENAAQGDTPAEPASGTDYDPNATRPGATVVEVDLSGDEPEVTTLDPGSATGTNSDGDSAPSPNSTVMDEVDMTDEVNGPEADPNASNDDLTPPENQDTDAGGDPVSTEAEVDPAFTQRGSDSEIDRDGDGEFTSILLDDEDGAYLMSVEPEGEAVASDTTTHDTHGYTPVDEGAVTRIIVDDDGNVLRVEEEKISDYTDDDGAETGSEEQDEQEDESNADEEAEASSDNDGDDTNEDENADAENDGGNDGADSEDSDSVEMGGGADNGLTGPTGDPWGDLSNPEDDMAMLDRLGLSDTMAKRDPRSGATDPNEHDTTEEDEGGEPEPDLTLPPDDGAHTGGGPTQRDPFDTGNIDMGPDHVEDPQFDGPREDSPISGSPEREVSDPETQELDLSEVEIEDLQPSTAVLDESVPTLPGAAAEDPSDPLAPLVQVGLVEVAPAPTMAASSSAMQPTDSSTDAAAAATAPVESTPDLPIDLAASEPPVLEPVVLVPVSPVDEAAAESDADASDSVFDTSGFAAIDIATPLDTDDIELDLDIAD